MQGAQIEDIVSGGVAADLHVAPASDIALRRPLTAIHRARMDTAIRDQYRTPLTVNGKARQYRNDLTACDAPMFGATPPTLFADEIYGRSPSRRTSRRKAS